MKLVLLKAALLFLVMPLHLSAQNWAVTQIPENLLTNANVVIRSQEYTLTISSPSNARFRVKSVYTILNEDGNEYAENQVYYDKFSSINDLSGTLYDANGKEIKSIKKKDIQDAPTRDGFSLMNDTRQKRVQLYHTQFPYTVAFDEETDEKGFMHMQSWYPQPNFAVSVQRSKYTIITPLNYKLRYKQLAGAPDPVIKTEGKQVVYTWEIASLPAKKTELFSPSLFQLTPNVRFAPEDFVIENYSGNMGDWNSFGKFIYSLLKGRDVLPETTRQKVKELTANLKTDREKIEVLYDYLQKNTRYISVQLGIGGWQPFDATYVATKKYGDCKALSNFMIALLKEAGISGKYALIRAGKYVSIVPDFPSNQFNHVVVAVPMPKDTVWLECTSQTASSGYQGSFTGDRQAVLVDDTGGYLVNTVRYTSKQNIENRTVTARVDSIGNLSARSVTKSYGISQENHHDLLHEMNDTEREKHLSKALGIGTYKVQSYNYKEIKGSIPQMQETIEITAQGYASVSGKRLFLVPNIFNRSNLVLDSSTERTCDIDFPTGYTENDTILISIPKGYRAEALPKPAELNTPYGQFSMKYQIDGETVKVIRHLRQEANRFPKSDWPKFVQFFNDINKTDRSRMVFVKN